MRPHVKRSLPIAFTICALALSSPHAALSGSLDSSKSQEPASYDLVAMNDSSDYSRNHYYGTRDHRENKRDYYTNQYGDLDTIDDQKNRRSRGSQQEGGIYAGANRLYHEELRQLDRELREDIRDELAYSPFVDEERVRVKVRRGVATLTGTVEDRSAMVAAVENAYEGGARKVINKLRVNRYDERPWSEYSDSRLEAEIYDEVEEGISVDVRDGVATLRGTVDDRSAMADAVENTYDVGARRVVNKLRLRN